MEDLKSKSNVDVVARLAFGRVARTLSPLLLCVAVSAVIAWPVAFLSRWMAASCVVFVTLTNLIVFVLERRLARQGRAIAAQAAKQSAELRKLHDAIQRSLEKQSPSPSGSSRPALN